MRAKAAASLLLYFSLFAAMPLLAQNEDQEGCQDHPLLPRMPQHHLCDCATKEFDSFAFRLQNTTDEDGKRETVEGKYYERKYCLNEGAPEPSALQIFRNYENAFQAAGATIVAKVVEKGNSYSFITARFTKNGMETWVNLEVSEPEYYLTIVERQAMEQVVKMADIQKGLDKDGFFALDIHFATGQSAILPESLPLVDQVGAFLKANPALKAGIEGHTDNTGDPAANKALSEQRARAVVEALAARGVDRARMTAKGWGPEIPVADNRTEEGRARNRRVEIVKK